MNNCIVISDDELNNANSKINMTNVKFESMNSNFVNEFSALPRAGMFKNGIKKIDTQMKKISSTFNDLNQVVELHKTRFFELEMNLFEEAQAIVIPTNYEKTYDAVANQYFDSGVTMVTNGRTINNGGSLETSSLEFGNMEKVTLSNISSNEQVVEHDLNLNASGNTKLRNINNGNDVSVQPVIRDFWG